MEDPDEDCTDEEDADEEDGKSCRNAERRM